MAALLSQLRLKVGTEAAFDSHPPPPASEDSGQPCCRCRWSYGNGWVGGAEGQPGPCFGRRLVLHAHMRFLGNVSVCCGTCRRLAACFGVQAGHLLPQSLPSPAESCFARLTDGRPAPACMHLVKDFCLKPAGEPPHPVDPCLQTSLHGPLEQ